MSSPASDEPLVYRLTELPGFQEWAARKAASGDSESLVAHIRETSAWLRPSQAEKIGNDFFDALLADLKAELKKRRG